MKPRKRLFRFWFYFRIGYSTYLAFLLGLITTVVSVYYLAILNLPFLQVLFPNFALFVIFALIASLPGGILIGWLHFKRTEAYSSEMDISTEANPYFYKLPPGGYMMEVYIPMWIELTRLIREIYQREGVLTEERKARLYSIEAKLLALADGKRIDRL